MSLEACAHCGIALDPRAPDTIHDFRVGDVVCEPCWETYRTVKTIGRNRPHFREWSLSGQLGADRRRARKRQERIEGMLG